MSDTIHLTQFLKSILTDLPVAMSTLEHHIFLNNSKATAIPLIWGEECNKFAQLLMINPTTRDDDDHHNHQLQDPTLHYSSLLIICSDLVYFPELFQPLISTLRQLTTWFNKLHATSILFGYKQRNFVKEQDFFSQLGRFFHLSLIEKKGIMWLISATPRSMPSPLPEDDQFECFLQLTMGGYED